MQIYNSDETLRGHEDPSIEVFLSPSTLTPYLQYNTRCLRDNPNESCAGLHTHKEDDIEGKLHQTFENTSKPPSSQDQGGQGQTEDKPKALGLLTDRKKFINLVNQENKRFRPLGKFIAEFKRQIEVKSGDSLFEGLAVSNKRPKREV